jgi:tetratricopeptide (TPR) repeat protein
VGQQQGAFEHKRFGLYLRRIREERRLSLDAVEEMSAGLPERVTKSHLSRIENGQAVPTFPRMFTLSQIYGVPVSFLAERFELCLKLGMFPSDLLERSVEDILAEAKKLRVAGRHIEALVWYEALLQRGDDVPDEVRPGWIIDLRLECINCLVKLARATSAKEECEKLLSSPWLNPRQRVITLQYLAMCSYKLGKFTVAMMAIDKAEAELEQVESPEALAAHLAALKGNLQFVTRVYPQAVEAYEDALRRFEAVGVPFEICRTRLNLAAALIELGSHTAARGHLHEALRQAEAAGYDRQRAYGLGHLGLLAYREDDLDAAESHCLRSNRLARPREYVSILFRNCYYLWRIAQRREDGAGTKANERTLRTYLSRVEEYMPEAEDFRAYLRGGKAHA